MKSKLALHGAFSIYNNFLKYEENVLDRTVTMQRIRQLLKADVDQAMLLFLEEVDAIHSEQH